MSVVKFSLGSPLAFDRRVLDADPIEIPLRNLPLYTFSIALDGRDYLFRLDWNGRESRWFFSLYADASIEIIRGAKLVCGLPLLSRVSYRPECPKGLLIAHGGEDPEFGDLGERVKLLYHAAVPVDTSTGDLSALPAVEI